MSPWTEQRARWEYHSLPKCSTKSRFHWERTTSILLYMHAVGCLGKHNQCSSTMLITLRRIEHYGLQLFPVQKNIAYMTQSQCRELVQGFLAQNWSETAMKTLENAWSICSFHYQIMINYVCSSIQLAKILLCSSETCHKKIAGLGLQCSQALFETLGQRGSQSNMHWAVANASKLLFEPLLAGRALREEICVDGGTEVLKLPQVWHLCIYETSPLPQDTTLDSKALFPKDAKKSCVIRLPILHLESQGVAIFPSENSRKIDPFCWQEWGVSRTLMVASTRLRLMVFHSHSQAVSWVVLQTFGSLVLTETRVVWHGI